MCDITTNLHLRKYNKLMFNSLKPALDFRKRETPDTATLTNYHLLNNQKLAAKNSLEILTFNVKLIK